MGPPRDDELLGALNDALARRGVRASVDRLTRRPLVYESSLPIEEIDVQLDTGARLQLVVKDLIPIRSATARPKRIFDPRRSIRLARLLDQGEWGLPEHWASLEDEAGGRFWAVYERVEGTPLDEAAFDAWLAAARWLGRFHASMSERVATLADIPLLRYNRAHLDRWMRRAIDLGSGARRERVRRLEPWHQSATRALSGLVATLVHGDFHASNILVADDLSGTRVCVLDWELAGVGPGLLDLAALTAGSWADDQRKQLVDTYRLAWVDAGGAIMPPRALRRALLAARLEHAIQWLGWASDWVPPADQARDWLAEAEAIADQLELGQDA